MLEIPVGSPMVMISIKDALICIEKFGGSCFHDWENNLNQGAQG